MSGPIVTIVEFDTWEHPNAWANDPAHREAQQLGRERYYSSFEVQVREPARQVSFEREDS